MSKREIVLKKTSGKCAYCGKALNIHFDIDHLTPKKLGGSGKIENLVPSCKSCNAAKGVKPLEEYRIYIARKEQGIPQFSEEQVRWLLSKGFSKHMPKHRSFYMEGCNEQ